MIHRANNADSRFLRACYFFISGGNINDSLSYHADTGCLPDDVVPQIPTNRMKGEDQEIPRICLGHTLDDCLTSIGIAHFVSKFLLAELRQNKKYSKDMPLPFIVRMYNIKDEDPNLLTEEETQKYVADSVVTSECWLTRYEKPVKIQKLWLVGGEVVLWPYIVDGVVYNYPIVRNSIWADSKTLPDPEFQNQIMDITQKWLNEA